MRAPPWAAGPVAEEIVLCSLKVLYIVCYIARVPVCVCDGRTILFCPVLGVFCDATQRAQRAQRELTNNSIDNHNKCARSKPCSTWVIRLFVTTNDPGVPVRSFASDTLIVHTVGRSCERVCGPVADNFILCSLKVIYIVCYIARMPVCVCDGRTILFC